MSILTKESWKDTATKGSADSRSCADGTRFTVRFRRGTSSPAAKIKYKSCRTGHRDTKRNKGIFMSPNFANEDFAKAVKNEVNPLIKNHTWDVIPHF